MEYELNITGYEKNPDYKGPQPAYYSEYKVPEEFIRKALTVRITEAQWEAIRKAVLENF